MSIQAMTWVWEHAEQKGTPLLMLLAIADHCNDDGICFPGVSRLAKKCRISHRQAQKVIRELTETGDITVRFQEGIDTGKGQTNVYELTSYIRRGVVDDRGGVSHSSPQGVSHMTPKPSVEPSGESSEKEPPLSPNDDTLSKFDTPNETANPESRSPKEPPVDTELDDMLQAVKVHLKQYGRSQQTAVAKMLLQRHKGKKAELNLSQKLIPSQLEEFCEWWDFSKRDRDGKSLTRPRNQASIKTWIETWLEETIHRDDGITDDGYIIIGSEY